MSEWKTYRLGDLCDSISNTYRGKAQNVVLINTSDVLEGKCLNHRKEPNKNLKGQFKKTFQQGDILYSEIRPSNKRFAYIDFDATDYIASTKLMVLRANEKIRPLYLYYILQSQVVIDELQMLAESRSGTFPQITFSELSLLTTELPDIDSQDKIINILKSLDDKIELNRRINANLEAQAQALFRSWFVDFEPFRDGPFVDSELGKIPQGWKVGTINEIIQILSGYAFKSDTFTEAGPYRLITIKNVQDGSLNIDGAAYLSEIPDKMPQHCNLTIGDILLSLTGNVGRVCIVDRDGLLLNQRVAKLQPKDKRNIFFTYALFRQDSFKQYLIQIAKGTAQLNLSPVETSDTKIVLPNQDILLQFGGIGQPLFDNIVSNCKEIITLSALRDTLLPKLMAGEIAIE